MTERMANVRLSLRIPVLHDTVPTPTYASLPSREISPHTCAVAHQGAQVAQSGLWLSPEAQQFRVSILSCGRWDQAGSPTLDVLMSPDFIHNCTLLTSAER